MVFPMVQPIYTMFYCAIVSDSSIPQQHTLTNAIEIATNTPTTTTISTSSTVTTTIPNSNVPVLSASINSNITSATGETFYIDTNYTGGIAPYNFTLYSSPIYNCPSSSRTTSIPELYSQTHYPGSNLWKFLLYKPTTAKYYCIVVSDSSSPKQVAVASIQVMASSPTIGATTLSTTTITTTSITTTIPTNPSCSGCNYGTCPSGLNCVSSSNSGCAGGKGYYCEGTTITTSSSSTIPTISTTIISTVTSSTTSSTTTVCSFYFLGSCWAGSTSTVPTTSTIQYTQTNPGWYVKLLWTNTSASGGNAGALQSIIIYNTTPETLNQGQSLNFIVNPTQYKLTMIGDTLSSSEYDSVVISSTYSGPISYANLGTAVPGITVTNITEPASELAIASQMPNAFLYAGQGAKNVTYDLTPYVLNEKGNAAGTPTSTTVSLSYTNVNPATWISTANPLTVIITGYPKSSATPPISESIVLTSPTGPSNTITLSTPLYNVTGIQLNRALPGGINITVSSGGARLASLINSTTGPAIIYPQQGKAYLAAVSARNNMVIYNVQNGPSTTTSFNLYQMPKSLITGSGVAQYFQLNITEPSLAFNASSNDSLIIGIDNSSTGVLAYPAFQLNHSASYTASQGTSGNITYRSSQVPSSLVQFQSSTVQAGFRTERGSKVSSITPLSITLSLAKVPDALGFKVSSSNSQQSYSFNTSIGSVLNGAVTLFLPGDTKTLKAAEAYSSAPFAFPETYSLTSSPSPSPYTALGSVPYITPVVGSANGGGVSFTTGFTSDNYDNIMRINSSQLPSLLSNYGSSGETEYLWLTGFPVFDQGTSGAQVNQFQLLDSGGAYQIVFNRPIQSANVGTPIGLLDTGYTIISSTAPQSSVQPSTTTAGGSITLLKSSGGSELILTDGGVISSANVSQSANTTVLSNSTSQSSNITSGGIITDIQNFFKGLFG
jgi:hypothetical protein